MCMCLSVCLSVYVCACVCAVDKIGWLAGWLQIQAGEARIDRSVKIALEFEGDSGTSTATTAAATTASHGEC